MGWCLSGICLLFNINAYAYTKGNFSYEIYFKFEVDKPYEEIKLLNIDSNHNKLENSIKNILTNESIDNIKKEISSKKLNLKIIR